MIRRLLACTSLVLCAAVAVPPVSASAPVHVHLGRQGAADRSTLVHRLGLGPGATLTPTTTLKTDHGTVKASYRQNYRGLPVFGCSVVIERNVDGQVLDVDGRVARSLAAQLPSVKPAISAARAVAILRGRLGLDADAPLHQVEHTLYVDPRGTTPTLAYHVSFFTPGRLRPQHPTALVDARDGHVIDLWRGLSTQSGARVAHPGTADPGSVHL